MDINSINAGATRADSPAKPSGELGKDDFLKLLLAQLRNQDPMKPMEDKEFITQMAQLNSLEQLQTLNERIGELMGSDIIGRASELIGRHVEALDESGKLVAGVVDSVRFKDGQPILRVGNLDVRYDDVTSIGGRPAPATSPA